MNICKTEAFVKIEMLRYDNSIVKLGVLEEVGEVCEGEGGLCGRERGRRRCKARVVEEEVRIDKCNGKSGWRKEEKSRGGCEAEGGRDQR